MVPKASPSFPPTKKRMWTPLHHLSRGSALAAVVEAASIAPLAAAIKTVATAKEAGRFRPILNASDIASSSRWPRIRAARIAAPGVAPARFLSGLDAGWLLRHVGHVMRTAAAFLEKRERPDLAGHFEGVAINRIVPAFDVD